MYVDRCWIVFGKYSKKDVPVRVHIEKMLFLGPMAEAALCLSGFVSLLPNLLLIYLIRYKSPVEIAKVKWVLFNNALVCCLLSIHWIVSEQQYVSGGGPGLSVILIGGILKSLDPVYVKVAVSLFLALSYYQSFSQCAIFVLHYIEICAQPNSTIRFHYNKFAISAVLALTVLFCTNFFIAYLTTIDGKLLEALTENLTHQELLPRNMSFKLYAHDFNLDPIYYFNLITVLGGTFVTRPIVLWCAFKVRRKLKSTRSMSERTAEMKSEMYQALTFQALFPVFVMPISGLIFVLEKFLTPTAPVSSYLTLFSFRFLIASQGIFGVWFVRPYRSAVFPCWKERIVVQSEIALRKSAWNSRAK